MTHILSTLHVHPLVPNSDSFLYLNCDGCRRDCTFSTRFSCRSCDFDLCMNCLRSSLTCDDSGNTSNTIYSRPITLYHGTSRSNGREIARDSLKPSSVGLLGPGIYFAEKSKAVGFAQTASSRGHGSGYCLIECSVSLLNCKNYTNDDTSGSWRYSHDSAFTTRTSRSFGKEWVVKSSSQIEVVNFYDEDGGKIFVNRSCPTRRNEPSFRIENDKEVRDLINALRRVTIQFSPIYPQPRFYYS